MNVEQLERAASLIAVRTSARPVRSRNGIHAGTLPGDGMDLYGIRPFTDGDDPRRIDPAASARTAELHVRALVQDTQSTTMLILDASASMSFGSQRSKWACASEAARVVARSLTNSGDQLMLRLSPGPAIPARSGRRALRLVDDAVAAVPAGRSHLHADLSSALAGTSIGAVVVVSDLGDHDDEMFRTLELLAHRKPVTVLRVTDPRELALPRTGATVTLRDPETGHSATVLLDEALADRYADEAGARHRRIASRVTDAGCELVELDTAHRTDDQLIDALDPRRDRMRRR